MVRNSKEERGNVLLRFLDRYAGIPIVFCLKLFKRKRHFQKPVHSIALMRTVAIGDTVLLTAIIADLKRVYPTARITFFAGSSNFEFAKTIENLDETILLPIQHPLKAIQLIRNSQYDIFIDCGPWPRLDAVLTYFSRSRLTIGFKTAGQYRHYLYDRTIEHSNRQHEIENYRGLIKTLGILPAASPRIHTDKNIVSQFTTGKTPYIVLHPWPGGTKRFLKEWADENWIFLAQKIVTAGFNIFITGSPSDQARSKEITIAAGEENNRINNVAGKLSLVETISLIRNSEMVVCVNTGIMHIAAALDVPMVALHGPTAVERWGPLSDKAVIISAGKSNCGYLNLGFEYPANPPDCMGAITVDEVLQGVKHISRTLENE